MTARSTDLFPQNVHTFLPLEPQSSSALTHKET